MVHGKVETGHVWEEVGQSAKHLVVLLAGVLWLLWDPRGQFCKKRPKNDHKDWSPCHPPCLAVGLPSDLLWTTLGLLAFLLAVSV